MLWEQLFCCCRRCRLVRCVSEPRAKKGYVKSRQIIIAMINNVRGGLS